ncbi:hypothetical protein [Paraburkholderia phenoliruptrix]|nr:hypothetical protein [Paraburkholderia phenoliruptrix]MBW9128174.1 hypothetical protein [Paraburkholderia ginsengiterrae]MBW0449256.1 hypothetical protein [Paraburkholderia phenoliruptrix]MBW9097536.1 hypothetical protein [Paraburkholderia phenoliruptrix]MBW9107404.1 hypothetical protein [Paraburkholderia phenoliruptrix]WMY07460.1 hypothetical protein P3F88_14475 [Paraburkholderia phenoliruptrix]
MKRIKKARKPQPLRWWDTYLGFPIAYFSSMAIAIVVLYFLVTWLRH